MMYSYLTFDDETEVTHSELIGMDEDAKVFVHFERPTENGFDSVRCELPSYTWTTWEGHYSDEELAAFESFLQDNGAELRCPLPSANAGLDVFATHDKRGEIIRTFLP